MTEAIDAIERLVELRDQRDYTWKVNAAIELGKRFEWLSTRQIATLAGVQRHDLTDYIDRDASTAKSSLALESLPILRQAASNPPRGTKGKLLFEAYEMGTSPYMIANLIGQSRNTVWNMISREQKKLKAAEGEGDE